jgi:hypothetical protein
MRRLISVALLLAATGALAQTPAPTAAPAPAAAPEAPAVEEAWTTEDLTSVRFAGERTPGPTFRKGTKVVVLVRDGAVARVMSGDRYGWVDAGKLSSAAPSASPQVIQLGAPGAP